MYKAHYHLVITNPCGTGRKFVKKLLTNPVTVNMLIVLKNWFLLLVFWGVVINRAHYNEFVV